MQDLWTRFQRDLTANWKKTAALGVLFLFGCCFWVPMLLGTAKPRHAAAAVTPPVTPTTTPTATAAANSNGASPSESFWTSLTKSLSDDPLFRPADMTFSNRDPFALEEDQLPLPVLITADTADELNPKPSIVKVVAPTGLELKSTMVSRTRRMAIINGQLYPLGKDVMVNGQSFRLTTIESNRVVLTSGEQNYELTLARPQLTDVLRPD